jgi:hypothetical protein
MLEVGQLRRMFERHMRHPAVIEAVELLARLFPPDDVLPDPETFRSQPGTVVKEAVKRIVGLPLPHDYTLLDTANVLYPDEVEDGEHFVYRIPWGFHTPMSDQIPFERAYELWEDRIFLRHREEGRPPERWRRYFRTEILSGIERATLTRLRALENVVTKLRRHHGDQLVLAKSYFRGGRPRERQVPERARSLIAFEELNAISDEVENRQKRALPTEEREARFISIRGIVPVTGPEWNRLVDDVRSRSPRYATRDLLAFTFATTSRDTRIKEGDFLLALSNEEPALDLDVPWRISQVLTFGDARELLAHYGLRDSWLANARLRSLLQVEVASLGAGEDPPHLVLAPADMRLFRFARTIGLLDFESPMVLDPIYRDFSTAEVEQAMRTVGGDPPRRRRRS